MCPFLCRKQERTVLFIILLVLALITTGCATTTITSDDFIPKTTNIVPDAQRFKGTVNVQFLTILTIPASNPWELHPYVNRFILKEAVEKAIAKNNLFTGVEQKSADYILDIWVHRQEVTVPFMGFGEFTTKLSSYWRLTRANDRKMFGGYIDGNGVINKGMAPSTRSLISAIQNMIQNGLSSLSEQSNAHLSSMSTESIRPHIEPWINNVKVNWSRLHGGLTLEEVESIIGPVKTSGAILFYLSVKETMAQSENRFTLVGPGLAKWEEITISKHSSHDYQCRSGIYTLEFRDDRLTSWKLY